MSDKQYPISFLRAMVRSAASGGEELLEKKIQPTLKECERTIRVLKKLDLDMEGKDESLASDYKYVCLERIRQMNVAIARLFISTSAFISRPFSFGDMLDEDEYLPQHMEMEQRLEGIFAFCENETIYIRMPLLPNVRNLKITLTKYSGTTFPLTTTSAYCLEVGRALEHLKEINCYEVRSKFERKTLNYLHVLEPGKDEADNDNRDTAKITNEVCMYLMGGDAPTNCRFIIDAVRTDELPSGTYLTVTPREKSDLSPDEIISFWKSKIMVQDGQFFPLQ